VSGMRLSFVACLVVIGFGLAWCLSMGVMDR